MPFATNLRARYRVGVIQLVIIELLFGQRIVPTASLRLQQTRRAEVFG
ncbi:hypothetical protein HYE59_12345 [Aggregatibacter actinomycetemcomitans]|nr:hypothetical protein [Aggregatibacter actinomycetemcomitans]MBN6078285.1 hypothetical protein [Aggregatibacter actinomycetemcomitans]